jgi:hypothetical protein
VAITWPLSPFIRWAITLSPIGWELVSSLLEGHDSEDPLEWRRVQCLINRTTPTGTTEDRASVSFDLLNVTASAPDPTWITADYTTCETALSTFWSSHAANMHTGHQVVQYRWYRMAFRPMTDPKPLAISGPPQRITTVSHLGSSTAQSPFQLALSVTERTAIPRHWGRMYLPCVAGSGTMDNFGRWLSAVRTAVATNTELLYETLAAAGFHPVVPVTQIEKQPARGLLGVTEIAVDDIPDVQRRRRPRTVLARSVVDLGS